MAFDVTFKTSALHSLQRLREPMHSRILTKITSLSQQPRPSGCTKLAGAGDLWRIRIGDYRVVYVIDDARTLVDIRIIAHRREVYRDL